MQSNNQITQEEIDAALAKFLANGGSIIPLAPQNVGNLPLKVNYSDTIEAGIEQMASVSQLQETALPSKARLK